MNSKQKFGNIGRIRGALGICCTWLLSPQPAATSTSTGILLAHGQSKSPSPGVEDPQDSEVNGNVYTNHYFGFSISYPKGWRLISPPVSSGTKSPSGGTSGTIKSDSQNSEQRIFSLLLAAEGSPATSPQQWRRVGILASKLKDPNISIPDHLKAGTEMLREKASRIQMIGAPKYITLAGKPFWKQRMTQEENGQSYNLETFVTKEKGYVLQIVFWALDETGTQALEPVIQSLRFF